MKVLHIATRDKGGGGYNAAYRLHCHIRDAQNESVMVVLNKESDDPTVIEMSRHLTPWDRLRWVWASVLARYDNYRYGAPLYFKVEKGEFFPIERLISVLPFKPDAIIVHWVAYYLTTRMMRRLNEILGAPLYWYMMDMAPLTGGCHYAFDCEGYMHNCGRCPQISNSVGDFDVSRRQMQKKLNDLRDVDITPVVPSSWLKRQAEASTMFGGRSVKLIMLGVDANIFKPIPQVEARITLGLPVAGKIVFFGAHNINEERKGIRYLIEALNILHEKLSDNKILKESIIVVTAGLSASMDELFIPFKHIHIGFLKGEECLAAAYQAADVFVNASIEDSGPMMINESILCGTPVVAFDMGVSPDLVHTGRTGYRAKLRDAHDMARGLQILFELDTAAALSMRIACRELGLKLCHPDVQVRAFMEVCA